MTFQAQPGNVSNDAAVPFNPPDDLACPVSQLYLAPLLTLYSECPHLVVIIDFLLSVSPPGPGFFKSVRITEDIVQMQILVEKYRGRALKFCILNSLMLLLLLLSQAH